VRRTSVDMITNKGGRTTLPGRSSLFELSPISTWEEDFSGIKQRLDELKSNGVRDLRKYLKTHPSEVIALAREVRIVDVNDATLLLYEARSKAELRRGLHLVFNKDSYDIFREELIALAEGKSEFSGEGTTKTLKGRELQMLLTLSVSPEAKESLSRVLISIVDITGLKESQAELRESEEKYRTIVESMPLPILLIDAETGIVLESNRRTEWLLGLSSGEIVGMHFMQLFPGKQAERGGKLLDVGSEDETPVSERTVACRKSGEKVPVTLHAKGVGLQGRACVLAVLHEEDRTGSKASETDISSGPGRIDLSLSNDLDKLSRREKDVIRLVASGLTNREIAERLFLSAKTVGSHRARIMEKLGVHKAADIVRFAVHHGLID